MAVEIDPDHFYPDYLRRCYGISQPTWSRRLLPYRNEIPRYTKVLTPKMVRIIYNAFGKPPAPKR